MSIQTLNANTSGTLISTTDLQKAKRLGKRISLKSLISIKPIHYRKTEEGTFLIDTGGELYELNIDF